MIKLSPGLHSQSSQMLSKHLIVLSEHGCIIFERVVTCLFDVHVCERLKVRFVFVCLQYCLVTRMTVAAHKLMPQWNLLHITVQRTLTSRCLSRLSRS